MINVPLCVIIALAIFSLGMSLAKHGELRTGRHSFWLTLVAGVVELLLVFGAIGWKAW